MQDLILLGTLLTFVSVGLLSPFVLSLGYVWTDAMVPNRISASLLASAPISLLFGGGAFFAWLLFDRRARPPIMLLQVLCVAMAIWITLTSTWAVAPGPAWSKWDPSFKLVMFVAFMPFVFRTRVQIEAFFLVMVASISAHLLPWGIKTLFTGGGYEQALGLLGINEYVLSESSSVAAIAASLVPFWLWFREYSLIVSSQKLRTIFAAAAIPVFLIAAVGTFARTGVIAIAVMGAGLLLRTRRKFLFLFLAAIVGGLMYWVTSDKWTARISTIESYQEDNSANGRVLIWKWTWEFAKSHPLGGGFRSYLVNSITYADGTVDYARAFHNSYFAVLGEHGYVGIALFLGILLYTLLSFQKVMRAAKRNADLAWAGALARAGQLGLLTMMVSTNFVDLSFIFIQWDFIALAMCLNGYMLQVRREAGARPAGMANPFGPELATARQVPGASGYA